MSRKFASLVLACTSGLLIAADWPQWLGPNRDNSTTETVGLNWATPPRAVWRKPMGEGNGGPVVVAGKVIIQDKIKDKDEEEVIAFDALTGDEKWRTPYPRAAFKSLYGNGPRGTPAVADGKVFTMGITAVLSALDLSSGKVVWQNDLLKTFGAANLFFGSAGSPLVQDGKVFAMAGNKGGALAALSATDGQVAWRGREDASYSSPIALGNDADRQIVFLAQPGLVSVDPNDGKVLWREALKDALLESSSTPALCGDILMASSITFGSLAVKLEKKDGRTSGTFLWKNPELTCYFATPVAVGPDHFYVVTGTKPPALAGSKATLHCVEASTGKVLWKRPGVGTYHATLLRLGDGKLLLLEENGSLVLIQPDPKEYRELARAKVCGQTWVHPAIADGRIYVRDNKDLICLELPR